MPITVANAFYLASGTVIPVQHDEWGAAKDLIDGGICQLTQTANGRVLEVL